MEQLSEQTEQVLREVIDLIAFATCCKTCGRIQHGFVPPSSCPRSDQFDLNGQLFMTMVSMTGTVTAGRRCSFELLTESQLIDYIRQKWQISR